MRITGDREERILAAFHGLGGGLQTSEIKKMLSISDNENKQFILSLRRLWMLGQISRIDRSNKWGHHSFYIPSSMFGRSEETRLADAMFGAIMSYLEGLRQLMPSVEAYPILLENLLKWWLSLLDPEVVTAYRACFDPSEEVQGGGPL